MSKIDAKPVRVCVEDVQTGLTIQNIRTRFSDASIKELAMSIFNDGLINPITVMETGSDLELVAGHRRLRAVQYILTNLDADWTAFSDGDPGEIPAVMYVGSPEDAEFTNAVENIEREEIDHVDTAAWLHRMSTEQGYTQKEIADRMNKSGAWVSSHLTLHTKSCQELRDAVRSDAMDNTETSKGGPLIPFTIAVELCKNVSQEEQKKLVEKVRKGLINITLEQAKSLKDPDKTPRPSKKKRDTMRSLAESKSAEGGYPNAFGVMMALRFVDGLASAEELQEVIENQTLYEA